MYYQTADRVDAAHLAAQAVREGDLECIPVLLARFEHIAPNYTNDQQEKELVFDLLVDLGKPIIDHVRTYVRKTTASPHHALMVLTKLLSQDEMLAFLRELVAGMDNDYWRHPEKKFAILHLAAEQTDAELAQLLVPFVNDHHENARINAIEGLFRNHAEFARLALVDRVLVEESQRIGRQILDGLANEGWSVAERAEKLLGRLPYDLTVTTDGKLARR